MQKCRSKGLNAISFLGYPKQPIDGPLIRQSLNNGSSKTRVGLISHQHSWPHSESRKVSSIRKYLKAGYLHFCPDGTLA
ncbi:MAG: hypothetical protein ACJAVI_001351 [Candidatus Azotimanducaceae bacterium]|jgi:hypothetical protein